MRVLLMVSNTDSVRKNSSKLRRNGRQKKAAFDRGKESGKGHKEKKITFNVNSMSITARMIETSKTAF